MDARVQCVYVAADGAHQLIYIRLAFGLHDVQHGLKPFRYGLLLAHGALRFLNRLQKCVQRGPLVDGLLIFLNRSRQGWLHCCEFGYRRNCCGQPLCFARGRSQRIQICGLGVLCTGIHHQAGQAAALRDKLVFSRAQHALCLDHGTLCALLCLAQLLQVR